MLALTATPASAQRPVRDLKQEPAVSLQRPASDSVARPGLVETLGIRPQPSHVDLAAYRAAQDTILVARPSRRTAMALLIAGGAGVLAGLIADEPAITIVSAGVAGIGIYLSFR
jgi:hypothetical protein